MKKVTFEIQEDRIAAAMVVTGKGLSETMREAVDMLLQAAAGRKLIAMRGKVDLGLSYEEIKRSRDWSADK